MAKECGQQQRMSISTLLCSRGNLEGPRSLEEETLMRTQLQHTIETLDLETNAEGVEWKGIIQGPAKVFFFLKKKPHHSLNGVAVPTK